jgi:hypothetical protein
VEILAIAPNYSALRRNRGHDVTFFQSLRKAAEALGHELRILVREHIELDPCLDFGAVPCLPRDKRPQAAALGLDVYLSLRVRAPVLVVVYEGNLGWCSELSMLALKHPQHQFFVNLFDAEPLLDTPARTGNWPLSGLPTRLLARSRAQQLRSIPAGFPGNLKVTGDTDERTFLARAVGIPAVTSWPLHSQIAELDINLRPWDGAEPIRILIPLAGRQLSNGLLRTIATVVQQANRALGPGRLSWTIGGALGTGLASQSRIQRLTTYGIEIQDAELDSAEYAELFASVHVAWLPIEGYYATQSSGKALDAVVAGTPVIAPARSFGANLQRRWVAGAPTYVGARGAADLISALPTYLAHLQGALREQREQIRATHSAETTVQRLVLLAESEHDVLAPVGPIPSLFRDDNDCTVGSISRLARRRERFAEVLASARAAIRFR